MALKDAGSHSAPDPLTPAGEQSARVTAGQGVFVETERRVQGRFESPSHLLGLRQRSLGYRRHDRVDLLARTDRGPELPLEGQLVEDQQLGAPELSAVSRTLGRRDG